MERVKGGQSHKNRLRRASPTPPPLRRVRWIPIRRRAGACGSIGLPVRVAGCWCRVPDPAGTSKWQTPRKEDKTNMCRSTGPSWWWLRRPRHGRWRHRQRRQTMATMETDKAEEDEEGIGSNPELSHAGAHDGFSRICSQGCASKLVVGVPVQEVGRAGR